MFANYIEETKYAPEILISFIAAPIYIQYP